MMPKNPWLRASLDAWSLALEASTVIALRTAKLAAGTAAGEAEARRMVREKIEAGLALQALALTGGLGRTPNAAAKTLAHYRRKVRANKRRLAKE